MFSLGASGIGALGALYLSSFAMRDTLLSALYLSSFAMRDTLLSALYLSSFATTAQHPGGISMQLRSIRYRNLGRLVFEVIRHHWDTLLSALDLSSFATTAHARHAPQEEEEQESLLSRQLRAA